MSELVYDRPLQMGEWAKERIGDVSDWGEYQAIGVMRNGKIVAACIFNHYSVQDVWAHIAVADRCAPRKFLRACFRYAFQQLGVRRITALVKANNTASADFTWRLGFKFEGRARRAFADDDGVIFGMIREECRFL